jgi:hypothetical protein
LLFNSTNGTITETMPVNLMVVNEVVNTTWIYDSTQQPAGILGFGFEPNGPSNLKSFVNDNETT